MTVAEMMWAFLALYGVLMFLISPKFVDFAGYFRGTDAKGKDTSLTLLTATIFISWIFAKSVTNAANLGAQYGILGGLAYATYWLCIPLAGFIIYRLRKNITPRASCLFLRKIMGLGRASFLPWLFLSASSMKFGRIPRLLVAILVRLGLPALSWPPSFLP